MKPSGLPVRCTVSMFLLRRCRANGTRTFCFAAEDPLKKALPYGRATAPNLPLTVTNSSSSRLPTRKRPTRFSSCRISSCSFSAIVRLIWSFLESCRAGMERTLQKSGLRTVVNIFVRLLTWLDGVCFAETKHHDRKLLSSLGRGLAQMDAALAEFSHPAAHRSFYWDLRNANVARDLIGLLPPDRRALVERFFSEWEEIDWNSLRFSVIHNDANDYNVLVDESGSRVTAILDYGD